MVEEPKGRDAGQAHGSKQPLRGGTAPMRKPGLRDTQHMAQGHTAAEEGPGPGLSDLESGGPCRGRHEGSLQGASSSSSVP